MYRFVLTSILSHRPSFASSYDEYLEHLFNTLSVTELCVTYTYLVSLSKASPFFEHNMYSFAITLTLFGQSHRPSFATCSAGKKLVRAR